MLLPPPFLQKRLELKAKEALKALKFKLENVAYGGGAQDRTAWDFQLF